MSVFLWCKQRYSVVSD